MNAVKRIGFWLFIGSIVFAILPILALLTASALTSITGCDVNEGAPQACMLLGMDIGELLYTLFVSMWFVFFTVPLGAIGAVAGLITYVIAKVVLYRRAA